MKAVLGLLILWACCLVLTPATGYADPVANTAQVEGVAPLSSDAPDQGDRPTDPYLGFGELATSAPLPVDCFNGNLACEDAPIGAQCWDGVCRCISFGYCHKP